MRPTNAIVIVEDPTVPIAMALARLRKKLDAEGVTRPIKNRHSRLYDHAAWPGGGSGRPRTGARWPSCAVTRRLPRLLQAA